MRNVQELAITIFLAGSCLVLAGFQLAPRLVPRFTPLEVTRPEITVAISGAVQRPGSFTLPWGSRVQDAVAAAGGLAAGAEPDLVPSARLLSAGENVYVPFRLTDAGDVRVSLNSSSTRELQELPGVGPVVAGRIIAGRPYSDPSDLLKVSGIGPATLERLLPLVRP